MSSQLTWVSQHFTSRVKKEERVRRKKCVFVAKAFGAHVKWVLIKQAGKLASWQNKE